jgi:GNAT superfamily N-acetyltransferase
MPKRPTVPAKRVTCPLACNCCPVHVRVRVEADLDGCIRLAQRVHEADGYPVYFPDGLRPFMASPDAIASWVVEEQGEIVGHIALHRRSTDPVMAMATNALGQPCERIGVVARLLVDPELRREGLGRLLLHTAAQDAFARNLWPILDVVTKHTAAIGLYEGCGWIRAGQVTTKFGNGLEFEEVVFLAPPATPE